MTTHTYETDLFRIENIAEETGNLCEVGELGDNVIILHMASYKILIDLPFRENGDTEFSLSTIRYEDELSGYEGEEKNFKTVKTFRGVKGYINKYSI